MSELQDGSKKAKKLFQKSNLTIDANNQIQFDCPACSYVGAAQYNSAGSSGATYCPKCNEPLIGETEREFVREYFPRGRPVESALPCKPNPLGN